MCEKNIITVTFTIVMNLVTFPSDMIWPQTGIEFQEDSYTTEMIELEIGSWDPDEILLGEQVPPKSPDKGTVETVISAVTLRKTVQGQHQSLNDSHKYIHSVSDTCNPSIPFHIIAFQRTMGRKLLSPLSFYKKSRVSRVW